MFRKSLKAIVVAVLLALALSVGSPVLAEPSVVLAGVCSSTASGCN